MTARIPLSVVLLLSAAAEATAQPPATPPPGATVGRKVAFLVGVGAFKHDLPNLNGSPQKDVAELARVLKDGQYEVVTLTDKAATRADVEKQFRGAIDGGGNPARALGKGDVLLVAVCTHGFTLSPGPGKPDTPFFAAHDSKPGQPDTMVSLNAMLDAGKSSGATILYLIDACRELADPNRGIEPKQVTLPKGTGVLFSCGRGQVSHQSDKVGGHGLFTHAVLKVLKGQAGLKEEVSWSGLVFQVERQFQSAEYARLIPPGKPQVPYAAAGELPPTALLQIGGPLGADLRALMAVGGSAAQHDAKRAEFLATRGRDRLAAWKAAAEQGDGTAQVLYGSCFIFGGPVAQDAAEGRRWLAKAGDGGHPVAMRLLALLYLNGRFTTKNVAEGARWMVRAAEAGDAHAMLTVAKAFETGSSGAKKDIRKAVEWYRKAADVGDADAITALRRLGRE